MSKCQKITSRGQCRRAATEGSNFCTLHSKQEDLITAYKLSDPKLNADVRHHALASIVKSTETMVKLARESGELLSRVEVEEFVDGVVTIVSEELEAASVSEDVVDRIAARIQSELEE